jgi:hypothetical protein
MKTCHRLSFDIFQNQRRLPESFQDQRWLPVSIFRIRGGFLQVFSGSEAAYYKYFQDQLDALESLGESK